MSKHFVSACCGGGWCGMCWREGKEKVPASHKVGEEFFHDVPSGLDSLNAQAETGNPDMYATNYRHNLTQYLCCEHFAAVMGPLASQWCKLEEDGKE